LIKIVPVRLDRDNQLMEYFAGNTAFHKCERVIVETEHGEEMGRVVSKEKETEVKKRYPRVVKKADAEDLKSFNAQQEEELKDYSRVQKMVHEKELDMKLVKVYYTFDRKKMFIYYTAEGRIDFRELIKELAAEFKKRIQMVQIGVRDEANILGGIGHCGKEVCCRRFLKDFQSVSIEMAKTQQLSSQLQKLTGLCGRLLCCLNYEYEFYRRIMEHAPRVGDIVTTPEGNAKVIEIQPILEEAKVEFEEGKIKTFKFPDLNK